jgi:formate/nitrite transporter
MFIHWVVTFLGNLAGSLFIVAIITGFGGVFDSVEYKKEAIAFAITKQVTPSWHMILLRGIGSNWLACMAWFLGITGREGFSKIIGIWWPSFAFISLGFDHVVANMFFVPMGIWQGAPKITVGLYVWKGIIPALIGNLIGGALFVGGYYWYQYLQDQSLIVVDGLPYQDPTSGLVVGVGRKKKVEVELGA